MSSNIADVLSGQSAEVFPNKPLQDIITNLKLAHKSKNYNLQAIYYEELADYYSDIWEKQTKEEVLCEWQPLIYACATYEYAKTILKNYPDQAQTISIEKKIEQLTIKLYDKYGAKFDLILYKYQLEILKKRVSDFRKEYEIVCGKVSLKLSLDDFKELKTKTTNKYLDIFRDIMSQCIKLCPPPPCKFEIIVFGSLATQLSTPFSDIEFAILVENEAEATKKHFIMFTILLFIKILNLGETPLRMLDIKELSFIRQNFNYLSANGITFDGIRSGIGKFSLPFMSDDGKLTTPFISTPESLAAMQLMMAGNFYEKEKIPSCIASSKSILANTNGGLHLTYQKIVQLAMKGEALPIYARLLELDLEQAKDIPLQEEYVFKYNLLKPLINTLIGVHSLITKSTNNNIFDILTDLHQLKYLEKDDYDELIKSLKWLLILQCELYSHFQAQREKAYVLWNASTVPKDNYFPITSLFELCEATLNINGFRKALSDMSNLTLSLPNKPIIFNVYPTLDLMNHITKYLTRDNTQIIYLETNKLYQQFSNIFLKKNTLNFFKTNKTDLFLLLLLRNSIAIITNLCQSNQIESAYKNYNNLLKAIIQLSPEITELLDFFVNEKISVDVFSRLLSKHDPRFPTLIAQLLYTETRFQFYFTNKKIIDLEKKISAGIIIRNFIDAQTNKSIICDEYNQHGLDSILWLRSNYYYLLFDLSIDNDKDLLELIEKYFNLMKHHTDDLFHQIDCCNNLVKIYYRLYLLNITNNNNTAIKQEIKKTHEKINEQIKSIDDSLTSKESNSLLVKYDFNDIIPKWHSQINHQIEPPNFTLRCLVDDNSLISSKLEKFSHLKEKLPSAASLPFFSSKQEDAITSKAEKAPAAVNNHNY